MEKYSFLIQQRFAPIVNRYDFYEYRNDQKGAPVAFGQQKRFNFREEINVWKNDSKTEVLFKIKAEKILDIHGKFLVTDGTGNLIGYFTKQFRSSLVRSTWEVFDAKDNLLFSAVEKNKSVAIIRRIGNIFGDLELLRFLPINFIFEKNGEIVGGHTRIWSSLKDTYKIFADEKIGEVDARMFLALGMLLDAVQDR